MTKTALDIKKLSPTEQALFAYLDEMLREGTESPAAAITESVIEVVAPVVVEPVVVAPAITPPAPVLVTPEPPPPVIVTTPPAPRVIAPSVARQPAQVQPAETLAVERALIERMNERPVVQVTPVDKSRRENQVVEAKETVAPQALSDWADNGRPRWAQTRFDVLIFKVAGLKLAVPLVSLGLIHPIDKKFHSLPDQADWFLGLLRTQGGNIKVIDTARHVMPERYTPTCRENLKFVITLHGYEWGLACHEVDKAMCLEPDAINWRTQRGKRPWMAGTVREHMCALIDAAGFHRVIEAVERNRHE